MITGLYGIGVALVSALILREPPRNISKKEQKELSPQSNDREGNRISTMIDRHTFIDKK
jgi:hypothetical protein